MIIIDGALGEGGGQILRTSLSLSMCLSKPVVIKNIRAGRKKPGLLRQHLTCVLAAKEICDAKVKGAELGSTQIEFVPGNVKSGQYHFSIGSAGSTTLVFQTVMPALLMTNGETRLVLEGGTHNSMAPNYDYIHECFLPLVNAMGFSIRAKLERYGFQPNGGGLWKVKIKPRKKLKKLTLFERGEIIDKKARVISAKVPLHVAERELKQIQKKCLFVREQLINQLVDSYGPGNVVEIFIKTENITEMFDSVGALGVNAERVAGRAIRDMKRFLESEAVVGEYLSDQLLLPLLIGKGGCFTTLKLSGHTETNIGVINKFIENKIITKENADNLVEVVVKNL